MFEAVMWIRICVIFASRIRIRINDADQDPDPGSTKSAKIMENSDINRQKKFFNIWCFSGSESSISVEKSLIFLGLEEIKPKASLVFICLLLFREDIKTETKKRFGLVFISIIVLGGDKTEIKVRSRV